MESSRAPFHSSMSLKTAELYASKWGRCEIVCSVIFLNTVVEKDKSVARTRCLRLSLWKRIFPWWYHRPRWFINFFGAEIKNKWPTLQTGHAPAIGCDSSWVHAWPSRATAGVSMLNLHSLFKAVSYWGITQWKNFKSVYYIVNGSIFTQCASQPVRKSYEEQDKTRFVPSAAMARGCPRVLNGAAFRPQRLQVWVCFFFHAAFCKILGHKYFL